MKIELTEDEALVLFELLATYTAAGDDRELRLSCAAERNALWAVSAQLEKRLVAPFREDYSQMLASARARVEEQGGGW